MVILVTGGSGFIGGHVVDKLIQKGYDVRVFDIRNPYREDVEWYRGDLLKEKDVLDACRDVEAIYHLAAEADVDVASLHPKLCLQVNEIGTLNLLRAATAKEANNVILASTTWVYGRTEGVLDEDTPLPPPDNLYTKTKIGQEHLVITWQKNFGLAYTILRYGIPYGPKMRSNMAVAMFVNKVTRKEPITIFGDGTQGRCFIYVEDLAEGNVAALSETARNQTINIAGAEFITINELVDILKQIFGEFPVNRKPPRSVDFKGAKISIEKARKLLRWKPKTPLRLGLRKYVKYIRSAKLTPQS